jgi:hypothetical protein
MLPMLWIQPLDEFEAIGISTIRIWHLWIEYVI